MPKSVSRLAVYFACLIAAVVSAFAGTEATTTSRTTTTTSSRNYRTPRFTLEQAILTAVQRNPTILNAEQEIRRTQGVVLQVAAQALPQINASGNLSWTDPNLRGTSSFSSTPGGTPNPVPTPAAETASAAATSNPSQINTSYAIRVIGSQLVFNYSTFRAIRGSFFQRDSAYFAFRNILDQVIATVKTQFFQVILDKALIGVQEESVRLLESQLKDQQNRFEAGTVPRFNVLQAQVALSNQIPQLIAARNAFRISQLTLAKTIGLDFNPLRGEGPPLETIGELAYTPRNVVLTDAIETGKQHRPFLKQARANVYNAIEQVHVALGGFLPNVGTSGGYEVFSSPFSTDLSDASKGWVWGLSGSWDVWDSGATYGRVKQQRALLSEAENSYDDDVRQVELEIQQAFSNLVQNRELIQATEKTVEQAEEALRLAKARLDAGAGTQLDVLNAQVQLTQAQSTRLQALFGYTSTLAEFDRVTGAQSVYTESFENLAPRATRREIYDTGSDRTSTGKKKPRDY